LGGQKGGRGDFLKLSVPVGSTEGKGPTGWLSLDLGEGQAGLTGGFRPRDQRLLRNQTKMNRVEAKVEFRNEPFEGKGRLIQG
jgi:hypothetical protein